MIKSSDREEDDASILFAMSSGSAFSSKSSEATGDSGLSFWNDTLFKVVLLDKLSELLLVEVIDDWRTAKS